MSTLKLTTLSNLAGSKTVPVDTVVDGSAKAWVNFNGTGTVTILASFNVSSITDNGTGDYTVNFTTAFADTTFAATFEGGTGNGRSWGEVSRATTTIRKNYAANAIFTDADNVAVAVHR